MLNRINLTIIIIFSFAIIILVINVYFHPNSILGEKPAVCDSGDKAVNSTESKICGIPTTNEIGTNAIITKNGKITIKNV
jgi:hypothetical protein